jgi:hypothetical protein
VSRIALPCAGCICAVDHNAVSTIRKNFVLAM